MFHNMKDVGFLQVKVIRAEALMAADVTGKDSFSFCDSKYRPKTGPFRREKKKTCLKQNFIERLLSVCSVWPPAR